MWLRRESRIGRQPPKKGGHAVEAADSREGEGRFSPVLGTRDRFARRCLVFFLDFRDSGRYVFSIPY